MSKILIVEDNKTLNQVYSFILEKDGHEVVRVHDGESGLKAVKRSTPDVILLDLLMPKMDGVTFLKKLHLPKRAKTTIVVLSNLDEGAEIRKARELGVEDYILKAKVSPAELADRVKTIIKQQGK